MIRHSFNRSALAVALVSIGFALGAQAQNAPSGSDKNPPGTAAQQGNTQRAGEQGNVPSADRRFADKAAQAGMAEVQEAKLVEQKTQDPQVKQFAQRMVQDHTQANDKLEQIASAQGIDLPNKLDKSGQQDLDKLQKLSADKLDKAYMKKQVSDHHKVIQQFQKEANSGKDAQIRDFAKSTLPTLQEHERLAKSAEQDVMGKAASSSGSSKSASSSGSSQTASNSGLKAAQKATGSTYAHAEKQEGMPVPKTGM